MEEMETLEEFSFKVETEVSPAYYNDLLLFIYQKYIVPYYRNFANVRRWILDGRETLALTIIGTHGSWYVDVEITAGNPIEVKMRPSDPYVPRRILNKIKEDLIITIQMFEDELRGRTLYFAWVPSRDIAGEKIFTRRRKILSQIFTGNMLLLFVIFIMFSYMVFILAGPQYAPIILVLSNLILVLFADKIIMRMGDWSITKDSPYVYILQYHIPPEDFDFIKQNYPRERLLQIKKDIYDRTLALGKPIDTQTVQEVFYEHGINIKLENLLVKNINVYEIVKRVSKQFNINMPKIRIANIIVPNAAATGPSPRFSLVLITTGLLIQLDEEEIFAVVGHEISHVKSRDPLALFLITSAEYLFRVYVLWPFILIFGFLYILFALTLVYFVAKFFEARADLESALILGKPGALANALRKIGYRRIWMERASNRVGSWLNMDPHPPLSFRIERLESLSESEPWRIKHPFLQSIKDCVNGLLRELGI